jgi:hypothetical protein
LQFYNLYTADKKQINTNWHYYYINRIFSYGRDYRLP